jgi:type IV pilus assembly protein PilA
MKKQQSGFTLIELMIVVAIIGILAAIAVPQYQNFMARSQASESIVLLDGAKVTIENEVVSDGQFIKTLANLTAAGVNEAGKYGSITGTDNTTDNQSDGDVVYKFSSGGVNEQLKGKSVWLNRTNAGIWSCKTNLSQKFAPKGCATSATVPSGS